MRFLMVALCMCVRRSDALGKKRLFVSWGNCSPLNITLLTNIFRCLFISPISLTPSTTNSCILLIMRLSRGWNIPATCWGKRYLPWECSQISSRDCGKGYSALYINFIPWKVLSYKRSFTPCFTKLSLQFLSTMSTPNQETKPVRRRQAHIC